MFSSKFTVLSNLIMVSTCYRAVIAAPSSAPDVEIVKRQAPNISPCLSGGPSLANGPSAGAALAFKPKDAPWFPNCEAIGDTKQKVECYACMAIAAGVYYSAISICTPTSAACSVGAFACEAVCIGVATYALWASEQACYCEHANCSSFNVRNAGRIGGPPKLNIGGQQFSLPMPPGWGYVGTRTVYIIPFQKNGPANQCTK